MKRIHLLCLLIAAAQIHSAAHENESCHSMRLEFLKPQLKGVLLLGEGVDSCKVPLKEIVGIDSIGLEKNINLGRLDNFLEKYYGQSITPDLAENVKTQLYRGFRDLGYPLVIIESPFQEVTHGTLRFKVIFGKVGEYSCKGNRWFSDDSILKTMRQDPGTPFSSTTLLEDLAWLNTNPFRNTQAIFSPGREPYTTDIELVTQDRFLLRTYAGADNTGTVPLGRARFFAGFDWAQAFNINQILSYQFTTGESYREMSSHTIHYTLFLPYRHTLIVYGGYSHVHPEITVASGGGYNAQGSLRYEIPLGPSYKEVIQQVELGFDVKSMNNDLIFEGEAAPIQVQGGKVVNITQLVGGFNLGFENQTHKFKGQVLGFVSPGQVIANQEPTNFESFRVGATSNYYYGRLNLSYRYIPLDYLEIYTQARVQWTTLPLIPSEQFAIGGYDTVRGYNEREYNSDRGVCLNFEIRSPCIRFQSRFHNRTVNTNLTLLAFLDYGYGNLVSAEPPQVENDTLYSVGPGIRYYFGSTITIRADYGFKLRNSLYSDDSAMGRFHAGGMFSF